MTAKMEIKEFSFGRAISAGNIQSLNIHIISVYTERYDPINP